MHNYKSTRHSALLTLQPSTYTCHVCHSQYQLSCSHPQHNSLSMQVNMHYTPSATHPTAFHNPPMHATNTRHNWQNSTRCKDGVKVLWCHSHLIWLRAPSLHALVFIAENFFVTSYIGCLMYISDLLVASQLAAT